MNMVIALMLFCYGLVQANGGKRLVLHSEIDIAQEFAKVNARIDAQAQHIENLTKTIAEKDKETKILKQTIQTLQNRKESGTSYVRWGRTTCSNNDTELVYHGYMGSSAYTTSGGGTDFLCLTPDPQWNYYDTSIQSLATIRGVEYQFTRTVPMALPNSSAKMFTMMTLCVRFATVAEART